MGNLSLLGGEMRRRTGGAAVDLPAVIGKLQAGVRREQIHVCFPQALDGAYVLPVALEAVGNQLFAVIQHRRNNVLAEVVGGLLVGLVIDEVFLQLFQEKI